MNWQTILIAILGIMDAGLLGRLIFFKASKKKADAEAEGVKEDNDAKAVETLEKAIEQMGKQNDNYLQLIDKLRFELETKHNIIIDKDESIATLQTLICKHMGCSVREPISGQGRKWFENYKEDISLGVDYMPINQLMRHYGDRKAKMKEEADKQEKND